MKPARTKGKSKIVAMMVRVFFILVGVKVLLKSYINVVIGNVLMLSFDEYFYHNTLKINLGFLRIALANASAQTISSCIPSGAEYFTPPRE